MTTSDRLSRVSRRALLQGAAAGAVLSTAPAWAAHAPGGVVVASSSRPSLGCWHGGAPANPNYVRAGWLPACASSRKHLCNTPLNGELGDATGMRSEAGEYRVRAVALANRANTTPVRVIAEHGADARHELWSAWRDAAGSVSCSSPVAVRMTSADGGALALSVIGGDGSAHAVALPARAGTYVLGLGRTAIRWRRVELVARDPSRPLAVDLVHRAGRTPVATPYLLLTVERLG